MSRRETLSNIEKPSKMLKQKRPVYDLLPKFQSNLN